jgi:hypothetical protein
MQTINVSGNPVISSHSVSRDNVIGVNSALSDFEVPLNHRDNYLVDMHEYTQDDPITNCPDTFASEYLGFDFDDHRGPASNHN